MHKQLYTVRKQLEQTGNTYIPADICEEEGDIPGHVTLNHR